MTVCGAALTIIDMGFGVQDPYKSQKLGLIYIKDLSVKDLSHDWLKL